MSGWVEEQEEEQEWRSRRKNRRRAMIMMMRRMNEAAEGAGWSGSVSYPSSYCSSSATHVAGFS